MELKEVLQKLLDTDWNDFIWGVIDETTSYLVVDTDKPNVFIITIQEAKIEVVE